MKTINIVYPKPTEVPAIAVPVGAVIREQLWSGAAETTYRVTAVAVVGEDVELTIAVVGAPSQTTEILCGYRTPFTVYGVRRVD